MKKRIFLMACLMYAITCQAQQIELNSAASIKRPKGMVPLTTKQIVSLSKKAFNGKLHLFAADKSRIYAVDNVVISLSALKITDPLNNEAYILNLKRVLDAAYKGASPSVYWSAIDVVNHNKFLISSAPNSTGRYITFYGLNKKRIRVDGTLIFVPSDDAKARSILKRLLAGIKYKV